MIGHGQPGHHLEVLGDRLGLAALLGADAGVRARGVDEGEDGAVEAGGQLHQPARLAVALGARHAEVPQHVLLGAAALLVAHHHHRLTVEAREAAHDAGVLAEEAIAGQLAEVGEAVADVVGEVRARVVAGELDDLPAGEVAEDLFLEPAGLLLQAADLGGHVDGAGGREGLQLVDLLLEQEERTLELEGVRDVDCGHEPRVSSRRAASSRTLNDAHRCLPLPLGGEGRGEGLSASKGHRSPRFQAHFRLVRAEHPAATETVSRGETQPPRRAARGPYVRCR